MKKILAFLLAAITVFAMTACSGGSTASTTEPSTASTETEDAGIFAQEELPPLPDYSVPEPMTERPTYLVSENPTVQELRETAVKAMHDMLSIQWCTDTTIDYNKTGAVSGKDYHYDPETIYCGLPYADGQTNLYVWLEYYDYRCGLMRFENGDEELGVWLNANLGNTCAGSLMWAWTTVCDSLTGKYVNTSMTPKYGCIPVGSYTYPDFEYVKVYQDAAGQVSTGDICSYNGMDVMFESYAQIQMADAITNSKSEHTMMVIENATVVRDAEGNINPAESYVILQDQAAGASSKEPIFYTHTDSQGNTYHYTGRTGPIAVKMTFMELYNATYIPVTTAEFAGLEEYVKPEVTFSNPDAATLEDLLQGTVNSNYPMSMFKLIATDHKGRNATLHTVYFDRYDVAGSEEGDGFDGKARKFKLNSEKLMIEDVLETLPAGTYTLTAEVTAPNGEIFNPISITYTK